jgi:cytosine/adenosine deaminase-related metal-dependent hydrolase
MISHISATYLYPVIGPPIKNGVLAIDPHGVIKGVFGEEEAREKQLKDIQYHNGLLVPGFVNTHCHLELSNLKNKIPQHTGLPEFVKSVIKLRTADEYELNLAILRADKEMYAQGVVAVGDISNQLITKDIKRNSPVYYHTFLEIMGFKPDQAKASMERAKQFKTEFAPLPVSIVPHAPYSVSAELFDALREYAVAAGGLLSIHNQETEEENNFFEHKTGGFLNLFEFLGQDIDFYKAPGKTSLQAYLPLLPPNLRTLLVHNTYTSAADVAFAESIHPNLYWCLCPNANLYIENKLPDVAMLRDSGLKITLGTDSLASNTKLSILAEMQILQKCFDIPVEELLKWATFNGAEFLGITERFGSFETGKRPGVNLVGFTENKGEVILSDEVKRLF